MLNMKSYLTVAVFGALAASAMPAAAADQIVYSEPDRGIVIVGGIGYSWLKGNELVYDGAGNRISHLIWDTQAPVFTLGAKGRLHGAWTVSANAAIGFSGNSHMEDYDWLAGNYEFNNWTHRSVHPGTELDRYLDLDIAVGYDVLVTDTAKVNLHGGFKYTNVKWTSIGGSFVYSTGGGFRNQTGTFPDIPGITYEQRFPGLFLGASAEADYGNWTVSGVVRGGVTIGATAIDHHWLRNAAGLRFDEEYRAVPFVSLGAKADYKVTDTASIFLGADYDHYFRTKGDVRITDLATGAQSTVSVDGGGADFSAFKLHGGLTVKF